VNADCSIFLKQVSPMLNVVVGLADIEHLFFTGPLIYDGEFSVIMCNVNICRNNLLQQIEVGVSQFLAHRLSNIESAERTDFEQIVDLLSEVLSVRCRERLHPAIDERAAPIFVENPGVPK
jgi:hypothetical protein